MNKDGFISARKQGHHFDLAKLVLKKLKSAKLSLKGKSEHGFELSIISHLQSSPTISKNLISARRLNSSQLTRLACR